MVRIRTEPSDAGSASLNAEDPYGVLERNNSESCLAKAVAEIAEFRPSPELAVSADGSTAVVRVLVLPRPKHSKTTVPPREVEAPA
jgi:hypothetical protein